jgi:nucleoid-associated protein YgaU
MAFLRLLLGCLAWLAAAVLLVTSAPRTYAAAATAGVQSPVDLWVEIGAEALGVLVLAWLAAVVLVTIVGGVPGRAGRSARRVAGAIAPAVVSSLIRGGLGLGAGAAFGTSSVLAMTSLPAPAAATSADHPWPVLDRASVVTGALSRQPYVVRPGDSLWAIAARHLGSRHPSAADIAAAWPSWWVANRDVVGDDPALIHPGQRLDVPTGES